MEPKAPEFGIIIGLLWIPTVVVIAYQWGVGKAETKTRIVKLSKAEI